MQMKRGRAEAVQLLILIGGLQASRQIQVGRQDGR